MINIVVLSSFFKMFTLRSFIFSFIFITNFCVFYALGIIEPIETDGVRATVLAGNMMECTVKLTGPDYKVKGIDWYYSLTSSSSEVKLFDVITNQNDSETFETRLTLDSMNAGYYHCQFEVNLASSSSIYSATFHDNSIDGVDYGESCRNENECLTLNAKCDNNTNSDGRICNCNGLYDITSTTGSNTIACYKHGIVGENCNIDNECAKENEELECDSEKTNKCVCQGNFTTVTEENSNSMCLKPVDVRFACIYNEQCRLKNSHSSCVNELCECDDGFFYGLHENRFRPQSESYATCVKLRWRDEFSTAALVGISFAILFGCVFVIGGIAILVDLIANHHSTN
ncbi:hypothetical protein CHUAL_011291 [Chamberlinius hualienensis]